MNVPNMRYTERLGRRVINLRRLKRIQSNIDDGMDYPCPHQIFTPKLGESEISVDRLDLAPTRKVAEVAKRISEQNNKVFYGWGVLVYRSVFLIGFTAKESPDQDSSNDYHASLYFPDSGEEKDKRVDFARELAEIATWLPYPE